MRIVVVLPLPLAPRKPQISPCRDLRASSPSTTRRAPKLLRRSCTSMTRSGRRIGRRALACAARDGRAGRTSIGWPGLISAACSGGGRASTMIDELGPARLAVDHGRRVFGLRRDEGDGGGEVGRAAVAGERDPVAEMDRGEIAARARRSARRCSRGGSSDTTGAPAAIVSPGRASTSATRPPTGAATWRWSSRHCAMSSAARAAATAACCALISRSRPIGARICASAACGGLHLGLRRAAGRRAADRRSARVALPLRTSASLRLRSACDACRASPCASARLASACWISVGLPPRWRLASCSSAWRELPRRLIARGAVGGVVLGEQRRAGRDLIAARDRQARSAAPAGSARP